MKDISIVLRDRYREYKRRLKLKAKEKKQQEKQAEGKAQEEEGDEAFRQARVDYVKQLQSSGQNPYPHKFPVDMTVKVRWLVGFFAEFPSDCPLTSERCRNLGKTTATWKQQTC